MKSGHIRLIVCPGIVDAPVGWLLSRLYKVPFVILAHGTDLMREGSVYRMITRRLFRTAEGVAANSGNTRQLLEEIGVEPRRIQVIPPGVDISFPVMAEPRLPEIETLLSQKSGPIVMTVGRVIRRKGIGEFIENVMPDLLKEIPNLHYIVVGGDASDSLAHHEKLLDQLQAQSQRLGLEDHIRFTGKVSDEALHSLLSKADLLVFPVIPVPGDVEGFGIVVLEGAVRGIPTVASRIGGIPDAVEDGKSGILIEPENWREMTDAVLDLLKDPEKRSAMGCYAEERAKTSFSWQNIARKYYSFFEEIRRDD